MQRIGNIREGDRPHLISVFMEDRGRKIAALKADIRMLTERKDWYDSQIASGRLNAEEIEVKQDILQHVLAALAQLSKELHDLEQHSGA